MPLCVPHPCGAPHLWHAPLNTPPTSIHTWPALPFATWARFLINGKIEEQQHYEASVEVKGLSCAQRLHHVNPGHGDQFHV